MKINSKIRKGLIGLVLLAMPFTFANFSGNRRLSRPRTNSPITRWQAYYNSIDKPINKYEEECLDSFRLQKQQRVCCLKGYCPNLVYLINQENPSDRDLLLILNLERQSIEEGHIPFYKVAYHYLKEKIN